MQDALHIHYKFSPSALRCARICTSQGPNGVVFKLFQGAVEDLGFDLVLWRWSKQYEIMSYKAKLGWGLLKPRKTHMYRRNELKSFHWTSG
jgi:hypothetical protein